jgi:anaerobic selenocysteine-containing dehydrogenase
VITPVTCPLDCADACGMRVETDADGAFVALRGNPAHGYSRGTLCAKTAIYGDLLRAENRLLEPLVRRGGRKEAPLVPATWDEAIARIVERVAPLRDRGHDILAAWYAGSMGRVQRFFPLRMMHALGATVVDGGLCDNSTTAGYEAVLGDVTGADLEQAGESDLVVLWGCDAVRTVQHLQPALQRLCKRGVPVLAIDVYRTDTIRALERWGGRGLVVRPGTDAALALAVMRLCYERGYADRAFLAERCVGHDEFERHVRQGHGLEWAGRVTGLSPEAIADLAERLGRARRPLVKTGVGFGRRRNGAMQMRAVCSLVAVLGRPEAIHYESFACFALTGDAVERPDLRPAGARRDVIRQAQLGREIAGGRFSALFVWGHNPAVVCPEAALVRRGLGRDDLFVVVHEQFLTETAALADVVLPATMFPEHADLYRSYGHRRLQLSARACRPPPGPRCNVDAFASIARALGLPRATWDATTETVLDELLAASPDTQADAVRAALRRGETVKVAPRHAAGHGTPSGRIELHSRAAADLGQPPMASHVEDDHGGTRGAFDLVCAPSVHTHNSTFSHSARHVRRRGAVCAWLHPDDARDLGVREGDRVVLSNHLASLTFATAVTDDLARGLVRIDGLPRAEDVPEGVGINALVSAEVSDLGASNTLYSTRVDVRRA